MSRIKFVTDSAADIPAEEREKYGIQVLPFPIAVDEKEYEDGYSFTPQEFYKLLLSLPQTPTHSQLTVYAFMQCYEAAYAEGYDCLIYTSINSKGSTTYQNSVAAKGEFYEAHPEAKDRFEIDIIDSRTYTMAYGYAVVEGAKMAQEGKTPEEILYFMEDWISHTRILFVPYDLKYAKKSGRISAAAAFMGEALGLKPIMTFEDGESKVLAKVRGEKNVVHTIMDMCEKEREKGTPYLVIRADRPDQTDLIKEKATEAFGQEPAMDYFIGGVVTINAGPNLAGIIFRKK